MRVSISFGKATALVALFGAATGACGSDDQIGGPPPSSSSSSSGAGGRPEGDTTTPTTVEGQGGTGGVGGTDEPEGGGGSGGVTDGDECTGEVTSPYATEVIDVQWGPGQSFGRSSMPGIVLGPPQGAGTGAGSFDVASLGNGGSIVLASAGNAIVDGAGPDFIVFENPFLSGSLAFVEPATVEVSEDGVVWYAFDCAVTAPYAGCAGLNPVLQNGDGPIDVALSGGDAFDLADVGISVARFVRITDRVDLPGTVFDLDAIAIVNEACP
ncbi:MAG: hypothetical protein AAGA56_08085 [Myxococcota bacterium]